MTEQKALLSEISKNSSLTQIQEYIKKVTEIRGFSQQPVSETMLLLLEETGELAKAVRKSRTTMSYDPEKIYNYDTVESEAADVFFVLTALCNSLDINIFNSLKEKELINCERNWKFSSKKEE